MRFGGPLDPGEALDTGGPKLAVVTTHKGYVYGPYTLHRTMSTTTIRIDTETRDQLRALGRMGEAYDDVIRRLLEAGRSGASIPVDSSRKSAPTPPRPLFAHQERK